MRDRDVECSQREPPGRIYNRTAPLRFMDLSRVDLPFAFALVAWTIAVPLLAWAVWRARWREVSAGALAQVWPAAIVVLVALWSIRAGVGQMAVHLSGIAALTLATGLWLGLVGGAIVVAVTFALTGAPWINAGAAWLLGVALPAGVTLAILGATRRWLPPNFFIYVFVVAFFGALLGFVATGLAGAALMVAALGVPATVAFGEYAVIVATLGFGEALLTGMAITLAAVYRPAWLATFEADRYFAD
jgi:uncharacterized membrane protein